MKNETPLSHEAAWDLIPWLVNGTLSAEEAAQVRAHVAGCARCSAEVALQTRMAAAVAQTEVDAARQQDALDRLETQLTGGKDLWSHVTGWLGALAQPGSAGFVLAGVLAAMVLIGAPVAYQNNDDFRTLFGQEPASAEIEVRVRFAPGADFEEVRAFLLASGAESVPEPTDTGLINAVFPDLLSKDEIARLIDNDLILHAATNDLKD